MHRSSLPIPDARADKPRGDAARTRRSRDGTWARKGNKSEFGYKLHSLIDKEYQFVRRFDTSTTSLHDSQIDLSQKGETIYRDKGYFGTIPFASIDKTMKRSVRGKPISTKDKRRNQAISRTRYLVERPFAVIKRVFHAGHVMVTTHLRAIVKILFACFSYNLFNLVTVQKNPCEAVAKKFWWKEHRVLIDSDIFTVSTCTIGPD